MDGLAGTDAALVNVDADPPRVSAVIPAYNAEGTVAATLASVQAQTYRPLEIVVVDDGSTDATPAIIAAAAARDSRIVLIRQRNAGVAAARNAGIEAARSEWVAPVDADDLWHPRKIELQMEVALDSPQPPGFVYCWSRRIDGDGRVLVDLGRPTHRGDVFDQLVYSNFLRNASTTLLRRDAVLAAGGFDPKLHAAGAQGAEDLKLYLAIAETDRVDVAPYFLTGYRRSGVSMSRAAHRMRRSIELVLCDLEARRPDIAPELLELARANYDIYAASVALSARNWPDYLRYLAKAARRAPGHSVILFTFDVVRALVSKLKLNRETPPFESLAPDAEIPRFLSGRFSDYHRRAVTRAAARPKNFST